MNTNKTVLITGASKNLGNYLTRFYLEKDFKVIGVTKKSKSKTRASTKNHKECEPNLYQDC